MVPMKVHTSVRSLQGPQLTIFASLFLSGSCPSAVQQWPSTIISGAHSMDLYLEKVLPLYFHLLYHIDEITPSLASEITKSHNSSQLRSYTNYYDR